MVNLFSYFIFFVKFSKNVTNLIKFKQSYCILKENELKYIIGGIWKPLSFKKNKKIFIKMEDFYHVSKSCY